MLFFADCWNDEIRDQCIEEWDAFLSQHNGQSNLPNASANDGEFQLINKMPGCVVPINGSFILPLSGRTRKGCKINLHA